MREIQSKARSSDNSIGIKKHQPAKAALRRDKGLIQQANKRLSLRTILNKCKVHPQEANRTTGWGVLMPCPLPDHKDGTASFGYNFKNDRFNCFGCGKNGGAVEFLANYNHKNVYDIAQQAMIEAGDGDIDFVYEDNDPKIEKLILEFSMYAGSIVAKYKEDKETLEHIEKVFWWIDLYLSAMAPRDNILLDEFEERLTRARELFDNLEDDE